jgi:putative NADH-flavin reductase
MRIAVLGANGRTGRLLVDQALAAGHEVTAVVRAASGLPIANSRLDVVAADAMDPVSLRPVIGDAQAVVSALSGPARARSTVWSDSTRSILAAMTETGVRRYVAITGSMLDGTSDGPLLRYIGKPIARQAMRGSVADMRLAEEQVVASELDWTIVRAPRLTDAPPSRRYRTALDLNVRRGLSLSRADLAACVLTVLSDNETVGRILFVAQ